MSLLGKYRKEEERKSDGEDTTKPSVATSSEMDTSEVGPIETVVSVPNKERKSPIVSFSIAADLRSCLQAVRNERAINLSMWVEHKLREAVAEEFPDIANKHLGP